MVAGLSKSCGCGIIESNVRSAKHNMCETKFYNSWSGMKDRSYRKKMKNYTERGISLCKEWHEFRRFRDDMYKSYVKHVKKFGEKNTTIDRIDNNGNYCKENCRWATRKEQQRNTSRNIYIEFKRKRMVIKDWADSIGIGSSCLWNRLYKLGWPLEEALTKKSRGNWKTKI
jgi:hypothetical protein